MNNIQLLIVILSLSLASLTGCKQDKKKEIEKATTPKEIKETPKKEIKAEEDKKVISKDSKSNSEEKKATEIKTKEVKATPKKDIPKKATPEKKVVVATPKAVTSTATNTPVVKKEVVSGPPIEVLTPAQFKSKIEAGTVQLLDIRTQREFVANRIKGAKNFDVYKRSFVNDVVNGGIDKSKPIYIYCLTGSRTRSGRARLSKAGFKKIYDLKGGIKSWYQQGLPIEK